MRQIFSCLSKLGGTTNFNTVPLWPSSVSILNGFADFRKNDNFSMFFLDNSAKRCRSRLSGEGKDASQGDLNLSGQQFSSKMNSLKVIFEKPKKCQKLPTLSVSGA